MRIIATSILLPVTKLGVTIEKVCLVLRQIRLLLLAMRTLANRGRRWAFVAFPSLHHLLVTGRSSM